MSVIAAMRVSPKHMERVFRQIPGLPELLEHRMDFDEQAASDYPEAAFVYRIVTEPVHRDKEINQINYTAIRSILDGQSVASVQRRHDRELDQYLRDHMWDA